MIPVLLGFALLVPGAGTGAAQALPTATAPGAYIAVGGSYGLFQADYGQRALGGAGAFVDLNIRRQIGIEAEARWLRQNQVADTHESTYLVGPRIQLQRGRLSPYAKFLVGVGEFNFPYDYAKGSYLVLAPGAGLDVDLSNRLKLRLVDFEYQDWTKFTYGTLSPYGISCGISFRILNGSR